MGRVVCLIKIHLLREESTERELITEETAPCSGGKVGGSSIYKILQIHLLQSGNASKVGRNTSSL
jgi:hypothetical protein